MITTKKISGGACAPPVNTPLLVAHSTRMRYKLRVTVAYDYSANADLCIDINITT